MEKAILSEFKDELLKMDWIDFEIGLDYADELLSDLFDKETDNDIKLNIAKSIYSIRKAKINPVENLK